MNLTRKPDSKEDEIPLFTKDIYWGKLSKKDMQEAIKVIDTLGWDEFDKKYKGKLDFSFEEDRADWRFNIPINKNSVVLDVGAGLGRSSIPLARISKEVVSFDQSVDRMRFLKRRAKEENLNNITIFVGDLFDLPLSEGSFDVVVMNGILEWVGKTNKYEDPRKAQIEVLKICKKLLKPDGFLYVGIENRFALSYLRGIDHSGLRFTSYMPRFLANFYTKYKKGEPYKTYTYTKRGTTSLFKRAGFSKIKTYLPYPGYNMPRILIPHDNILALQYVIQEIMRGSSSLRILAKGLSKSKLLLKVYRYLFFSFNIIAQK